MNKILKAIAADPWHIKEDNFKQILEIASRFGNLRKKDLPEKLSSEIREKKERTESVLGSLDIPSDMGLIPVIGPIFRYANLFTEISGATSLSSLSSKLASFKEDPTIKSVLFFFDSPGGQANGIHNFARAIRSFGKPVYGYADSMAASAAYWLFSATHKNSVSETSILGSIGTIASYYPDDDDSITFISSQSPKKNLDPETEEGRGEIQSLVDSLTEVFINEVAFYRSVSPEFVLEYFGQGGVFTGSKAFSNKMSDQLDTFDQFINGLETETRKEGFVMSKESKVYTPEMLKEEHPDTYKEVKSIGFKEGQESATKAERERMKGVLEQVVPGYEGLVQEMLVNGSTPEHVALAIVQKEKARRDKANANFSNSRPQPSASAPTPLSPSQEDDLSNLPVEERTKKEWDSSPKLRSEFSSYDAFFAFAKASENGQVRFRSN